MSKPVGECSDEELLRELARRRAERETGDVTAMEDAVEQAQQQDGQATLRAYFDQRSRKQPQGPVPCPRCGKSVGVKAANRERTLQTIAGEITYRRNYHYCPQCEHGFYPLDEELGVSEDGELTGKLEARIADFGINMPFVEGAERWSVHHRSKISENLIRRVIERVGKRVEGKPFQTLQADLRPAPATAPKLLVVQTDGSMLPMRGPDGWKESKLCVVYGSGRHDTKGRPRIERPRYIASLRGIDAFRKRVDCALEMEKADEASQVAWVGDGALSNWNLAQELCPKAIQILDWTHAVEHAALCAKTLFGEGDPCVTLWTKRIEELLAAGSILRLIAEIEQCLSLTRKSQDKRAIQDLIRYYRNNQHRMNYRLFRDKGLPIGSGTVESAHRHVLQRRMKLAGQHWNPTRAERMATLRAAYKTAGPLNFHQAFKKAA